MQTQANKPLILCAVFLLLCVLWPFYCVQAAEKGDPGTLKWRFDRIGYGPAIGIDGTLYAVSLYNLLAIQPLNGAAECLLTAQAYFGFNGKPVIATDGTIYTRDCYNGLYAINPTDGSVNWTYQAGLFLDGNPAIGADGTIYVLESSSSSKYSLNALCPADGSVIWTCDAGSASPSSPYIGADGTVYFVVQEYGTHALWAIDPADGSLKWEFVLGTYLKSLAIGTDGTIYASAGALYAIEPADGGLLWTCFKSGSFSRCGHPVVGVDGTVYVAKGGNFHALDATDGTILWTSGIDEEYPAVGADGTIYVCSAYSLCALDATDGSVMWTYTGEHIGAGPSCLIIGEDGVAYMLGDNVLQAVYCGSPGPAESSWPLVGHDVRQTNSAQVPVLQPPVMVTPSDSAGDQPFDLLLQWRDGNYAPQENSHQVRIKEANGAYTYYILGRDSTYHVIYGLEQNTAYQWNVRALGDIRVTGNSGWANGGIDWQFTTSDGSLFTLNPPVLTLPTHNADKQPVRATLQWQGSNTTPREWGHRLRIKEPGGNYMYYNVAAGAQSFTVPGLSLHAVYLWNVRALGDGAYTLDSQWANAGVDYRFATIGHMNETTVQWSRDLGSPVWGPLALAADGTVYAGTDDGTLYALNAADGSTKWNCDFAGSLGKGPAVGRDGTVYAGSGHLLYAIHPTDGNVKWTCATGPVGYLAIAEEAVYASSNQLYAVQPANGDILWSVESHGDLTIGMDGTIYVYDRYNYHTLCALDPADGHVIWQYDPPAMLTKGTCPSRQKCKGFNHPIFDNITGDNGTLYQSFLINYAPHLCAIDPATGSTKWISPVYGDTETMSCPVIGAGGQNYIHEDACGIILAFSPVDGSILAQSSGNLNGGPPAIGADGTLYISGDNEARNRLCTLHTADLSGRWCFQLPAGSYSIPLLAPDGTVYLCNGYYGTVYALATNCPGLADSPWPMIDHDVRHSCSAEIVTLRPPVLLQPGNNAAGIQRDVTLQWRDCNYAPQEAGCQVRIKPAGGAYTYYMVDKDMAEKYISGLQVDASYLWNVRALGNGQNTLDSPWANSGEDWSFHTLDMFGLR